MTPQLNQEKVQDQGNNVQVKTAAVESISSMIKRFCGTMFYGQGPKPMQTALQTKEDFRKDRLTFETSKNRRYLPMMTSNVDEL
ncbi:hypothetical protein E2562_011855 [Oryza meyeriana var. granulata]|uniref:Uncharacterized protein n=1 Tax=Oryza meyeriana var. granulata TaxID=110450 RepID=A0A6G1CPE3_9ORYZ|nr:hypothetical protein E2562_011855 [Oryza meyeriana var. granulata]